MHAPDWLRTAWLTLIDCFEEFRRLLLLWISIFVLIVGLDIGLTIEEFYHGETLIRKHEVGAAFVAEMADAYNLKTDTKVFKHYLFESCSWRQAIANNHRVRGDLVRKCFYMTLISVTTVGFGDVVPSTFAGKMITVADALVGFAAFGLYVHMLIYGLRGILPGHRD